MRIEPAGSHRDDWLKLRLALWDDASEVEHRAEIDDMAADQDSLALLAMQDSCAVGLVEAALRHDYVNGCETSPVAFLEGLFVDPAHRRTGIARSLVAAAERWGRDKGCAEFASDADLANVESHAFHAAFGFTETERVVYFRKPLR